MANGYGFDFKQVNQIFDIKELFLMRYDDIIVMYNIEVSLSFKNLIL